MHKGVIVLVKAEDRDDAVAKVNEFMEGYEGQVWDWFQIGGRWQGLLTGYEPSKDPKNFKPCGYCDATGKRKDMEVANGCNACIGTGKEPLWPSTWGDYDGDSIPLSKCLEKVKEYRGDLVAQEAEYKENISKWASKSDRGMVGYETKNLGKFLSEDFSFEANVFNVEMDSYEIPEDVEGWFAVVVDMHN